MARSTRSLISGAGQRGWWSIGRWVVFAGLMAVTWLTNCSDPIVEPNKPPDTPSNPTPSDNSITALVVELEWRCSDPNEDQLSYDVHFGMDTIPPLVATNYTLTTYSLDTLEYDTPYYWKVVAKDNQGAMAIGPVWRFKTRTKENVPPDAPRNPTPSHTQTGVVITTSLSWASSDMDGDPLTHDVYLDTANPPVTMVAADTSATIIEPPGELSYGTDYCWRVVVRDTANHEVVGDVWTFRTASNQAPQVANVLPADAATDVNPRTLQLVWNATDPDGDPLTYDVILDTDTSPVDTLAKRITETTLSPLGLIYGGKYYWRIVARDGHGNNSSSPWWSFTTRSPTQLTQVCRQSMATPQLGIARIAPDMMSVVGRGGVWYASVISDNCVVTGPVYPRITWDVVAHVGHLLLACWDAGFQIVSLQGAQMDSCALPPYQRARAVTVAGDYAYVVDWDDQHYLDSFLRIYNVSDTTATPCPADSFAMPLWHGARDVEARSGIAFVQTDYEVAILDVARSDSPFLITNYYPPGINPRVSGIALSGNFLYVTTLDSLFAVDVTIPAEPRTLRPGAPLPHDLVGGAVFVEDSWAYVSQKVQWTGSIGVFDVRDPSHPRLAGYSELADQAIGAAVVGDYLYVVEDRAITVFDKSLLE